MKKNERFDRRDALKILGIGGATFLTTTPQEVEAATQLSMPSSQKKARIIIAGGGTGGMIAAARIRRAAPNAQMTMIAPNAIHLYQPGQTLVAADLYQQYENEKETSKLLPNNVAWLQERVAGFMPEKNMLVAEKSGQLPYDILIVALGLEYDFTRIEGLDISMIGKNGIASVYLNDTITGKASGGIITRMWQHEIYANALKSEVNVLFTEPDTPIKGIGTTLDLLFLGNDLYKGNGPKKKNNVQKNVHFAYAKSGSAIFPAKEFESLFLELIKKSGNMDLLLNQTLKSIDTEHKIATLDSKDGEKKMPYDFIHIVPPMQAPKVLRNSPLAITDGPMKGWMSADPETLRHPKYQNVFGIGDVLGIPLGKTTASAQQQGLVLQDNIAAALEGKKLPVRYNGRSGTFVATKYGEALLLEYDTKEVDPTHLLDPTVPRWLWWMAQTHVMRWAYFNLLMRGMM